MVERRIVFTVELAMSSCPQAQRLCDGDNMTLSEPFWERLFDHVRDVISTISGVKNKTDMVSPLETFYGRPPFARVAPFLRPGFYHVRRTQTSEPNVELLFILEKRLQPPTGLVHDLAAVWPTLTKLLRNTRGRPLWACNRLRQRQSPRHHSRCHHHQG